MFRFINVMITEIRRIVYIPPYPIGLPIPSAAGSSTSHLCIIVTSTIVTSPSLSTSATFSSNSNGSGILASIRRTPCRGQRRILRGYRSHAFAEVCAGGGDPALFRRSIGSDRAVFEHHDHLTRSVSPVLGVNSGMFRFCRKRYCRERAANDDKSKQQTHELLEHFHNMTFFIIFYYCIILSLRKQHKKAIYTHENKKPRFIPIFSQFSFRYREVPEQPSGLHYKLYMVNVIAEGIKKAR